MKTSGTTIGNLAAGFVLACCLTLNIHAQTAVVGSFNSNLSLVQAVAPDSIVQITAEAQGLSLVTPGQAPRSGTFWTVTANGDILPYPCPPQNNLTVPIYQLPGGQFLVDQTDGQIPAIPRRFGMQAQATSSAALSGLDFEADTVLNLILSVQMRAVSQQMGMMSRAMGMDVPSFNDTGNGGTNGSYSDSFVFNPDYGTNLWLVATNLAAGQLSGVVSNTTADIQYELQFKNDLAQSDWQSAGWFTFGSEITNWTAWSVPMVSPTNLFLRVRSWQDDGSGLPLWWQAQYFGTNSVDPYGDPAGDGWNNLQKFQNGMNPNVFYTPPAPQGVAVSYNSGNGTAGISWQPSPGPVTGYTVEKTDNFIPGGVQTFNVSSSLSSFQDNVSSSLPDPFDGGALDVSYTVQAHYSGGDSSWSDAMPLEQTTFSANIIGGPQGSAYVTTSPLPSGTTALRVTLFDQSAWLDYFWGLGSEPVNPTFDIPVSDPAQGQYAIPAWSSQVAEAWQTSYAAVQAVNANGNISAPAPFNPYSTSQAVAPYFDGRAQLKQNLIFLLRAATVDSPFSYVKIDESQGAYYTYYNFTNPRNYAFSGFYPLDEVASDPFYDESVGTFDAYWPFESNYRYRNFVLNSTNLDSNGHTTTGAGGDYGWLGLTLTAPPMFQFQAPATNGASIPALLATNATRWLSSYAMDSSDFYLWKIGATNDTVESGMFNNVRNWFGLPFLSANISGTTILSAGNTTTANGYFYPETAQPQFQLSEYDFWDYSPIPGSSGFSTTNKSDILIAPVGGSILVNGYAKLAVLNGYSGIYGYLGQYFTTNAYALDSGGNITTNTTGILSPYGNFFATEPGAAALLTMPDIDTGQRGTSTVYCVSLNVDKNHDGVMDLSFNGADATSQSSPMEFWVNNGYIQPGSNGGLDKDMPVPPNPTNYTLGTITCQRDLENFARLWICGLPQLPPGQGYAVTMSMSPSVNNPAVNLYWSCESDGGIGYLTDTNIAVLQTVNIGGIGYGVSMGTVSNNLSYTFPDGTFQLGGTQHLLIEGAGIGSGELLLTISQNGNTIAQTGVWLDLHDVKDFFEHPRASDVSLNDPPTTNSGAFQMDSYATVSDAGEDKEIVVYVHGLNNNSFDYESSAQTIFKRLYWQGYRGRYAAFRWPSPTWSTWPTSTNQISYFNYNKGEYISWQSGAALKNYIDGLHVRFSDYSVNIITVSEGGITANAAVRLGAQVDNLVLSKVTVPAEAFDGNNSSLIYSYLAASAANTPDADTLGGYNNCFTNQCRRVNFYNDDDFACYSGALGLVSWEQTQLFFRPDHTISNPGWEYTFDGTNCYNEILDSDGEVLLARTLTQDYEKKSYVARSRTKAIGAAGLKYFPYALTGGAIANNISLQDASLGFVGGAQFGDSRPEHGGEFNKTIQNTTPFYKELLSEGFLIAPNP